MSHRKSRKLCLKNSYFSSSRRDFSPPFLARFSLSPPPFFQPLSFDEKHSAFSTSNWGRASLVRARRKNFSFSSSAPSQREICLFNIYISVTYFTIHLSFPTSSSLFLSLHPRSKCLRGGFASLRTAAPNSFVFWELWASGKFMLLLSAQWRWGIITEKRMISCPQN